MVFAVGYTGLILSSKPTPVSRTLLPKSPPSTQILPPPVGYTSLLVWRQVCTGMNLCFGGLGWLIRQILYAEAALLAPISFFPKTSILLLYREIFTVHRSMMPAIYLGLILTGLQSWPTLIFTSYYLAPHVGQSWSEFRIKLFQQIFLHNVSPTLLYWVVAQGVAAVILDLYIFFLPMPIVSRLRLPRRARAQVFGIFSTAMMWAALRLLAEVV